jgi:glycosyltransferase involved in cell wall biosynthesis
MNILYLSQSYIPSKEANSVHVMKMCHAFATLGCHISLLVPEDCDGNAMQDEPFEFYGVKPVFDLIRTSKIPILPPSISYILGCVRFLSAQKPDLVFSRSLTGSLAAGYSGFPVVFEFHQPITDYGAIKAWLFKRLIDRKKFIALVVVTKSLKAWYQKQFHLPEEKIIVAPDGADIPSCPGNSYADLTLPKAPGTSWHVAYVGGLYAGKGMEIICCLARRCPDVNFHIIGGRDGDIAFWKSKSADLKNIFFHGFCPPARVFLFMRKMDVLLAPNLRCVKGYDGLTDIGKWTSPLKLFEYMASQVPILASDIDVLKEVLIHEVNALLCDPDSIDAWREGLYRLLHDRSLAARLADRAFENLKEKYTWSRRAENLFAHIKYRYPELSLAE